MAREPDDDDASRRRDQVERQAHRLLRTCCLDHDLGQLAARPVSCARLEVVSLFEEREIRTGSTAVETLGDPVDEQHLRASVERRNRDGVADGARAENDDMLVGPDPSAHDRTHGDRHRLDERSQARVLQSDGERLLGGDAEELLQRPVDVDPDEADVLARVLAADPAAAAVPARRERPDRNALPGREVRRAARPDLLDDRRELVSLDARVQLVRVVRQPDVAVEVVEVRAAEADRLGPDDQLVLPSRVRLGHVDDLHHASCLRQCGPHGASLAAWGHGDRRYARGVRRYHVTTFGCQMNAHDSERIKGMLESIGLGEAPSQADADVLVFNTCTIREKPDTKLAAYLGDAGARKRENPELVVAVGGCYAEAQRDRIFELYPQVDVAFGPGSIPHLGEWLGAGGQASARAASDTHEHFAGDLPMHRERAFSAWVQVSMGCNSKCAYCIVPAVRGREQSRRPGEIVAEVTRLAADGVREVTLLGQNVNSWGRDLRPELETEFGELLRACDAVDGIDRIRFTSPHPKDFRDPVIAAMVECDAVCEHVHLPLQSGSSRILKAMRRTYDRERYLRLVAKLRDAIPGLVLGTDVIVGFPGETEDDFQADAGGRGSGSLRQRLHVHLLAAARHRGGGATGPGAGRGQARTARTARRGRAADRVRAKRRARRNDRRGARGGVEPNGRDACCADARAATRWSTSRATRFPASSPTC